jgi:hypothetical protein
MLEGYPRAVVLDVKYDFVPPWPKGSYVILNKPEGNLLTGADWSRNRIIYRPKPPYDDGEWVAWWLDRMFDRARREGKKRPFILYLDEGAFVSTQGAKAPIGRLAIAGRSLGVGLWVTSQRPRTIPVEVRSEAWRTYVFFLQYQDDRTELRKYSGGQLSEDMLTSGTEDYSFWELRRGKGGAVKVTHYPPVRTNSQPVEAG